ncbi:unnamed protein product, partial [Strongylus vulgaris]
MILPEAEKKDWNYLYFSKWLADVLSVLRANNELGTEAFALLKIASSNRTFISSALLNHALNQPKEELKTHFTTREGTYKLMTMAEYSRPNRVPMNQMQPGAANVAGAPVRVSFLSLNSGNKTPSSRAEEQDFLDADENYREELATADRICFNVGRELYVYLYKGIHTAADLSKPIDKRVYKGTYPTCHHFNQETATSTSCSLIIGFSAGQIQLIDPFHKEYQASRLYNEERFIDKTGVTCLRWVP